MRAVYVYVPDGGWQTHVMQGSSDALDIRELEAVVGGRFIEANRVLATQRGRDLAHPFALLVHEEGEPRRLQPSIAIDLDLKGSLIVIRGPVVVARRRRSSGGVKYLPLVEGDTDLIADLPIWRALPMEQRHVDLPLSMMPQALDVASYGRSRFADDINWAPMVCDAGDFRAARTVIAEFGDRARCCRDVPGTGHVPFACGLRPRGLGRGQCPLSGTGVGPRQLAAYEGVDSPQMVGTTMEALSAKEFMRRG